MIDDREENKNKHCNIRMDIKRDVKHDSGVKKVDTKGWIEFKKMKKEDEK